MTHHTNYSIIMKCPHCKKEHEEGTIFCPFTGKEILPQMQSCPRPDCVNYGKNNLPSDFQFCPVCGRKLGIVNPPPPPSPLPEKRYKIIIQSAEERIVSKIDRIAGTNLSDRINSYRILRIGNYFPHELYEERIVESKALILKKQLEALGAKVELQRLNSSTVADFRNGHIFVNNVVLGKTRLQELLTKKYRRKYGGNIDDWMAEEIVDLDFEPSERISANIRYLNPDLNSSTIAEIQSEYAELFISPSDSNFSFVENRQKVVNYFSFKMDEFPCFAEMGIDEELLLDENHSDEYIERRTTEILESNGWSRISDFLIPNTIFANGNINATFKCSKRDETGNDVFMILSGDWYNCDVVIAINLIR